MADFDRRPRRGGGQFNNRKRRYRDDDFDDRRPTRRRYEEPLSTKVRKQVLSIAESPVRRVEEDVAEIAKIVAENYFDSDLTSGFLDLIAQMTTEQPLKIPFIASIVLLANAQKPEFTTEVLKRIGDHLQMYLEEGRWRDVKLSLRFLGCLQGLFEGDGIFTILEELFTRAADLQMKSSEDALGLELVKVILFTIPYTMASSATGFESQANALLEKTDIIASTPHILENLVDPFPPNEPGAQTSHESALALMQKHMSEEAKNGWELSCLPRPWKATRTPEEEQALTQAQKHPFPGVLVPENVQIGPKPVFPEIYFSVYTEQEMETIPSASDSGSLLIRDGLTDTIDILDYNRIIAAKFLIDMDCYFAPNTFVKRATPFDKLRDVAGDKNTWKPEDVVVDAAFATLLQLPAPEHKLVYYHSVLTEACKLAPAAVAPSLGRAIRFLYRNVERMDLELRQRFLDWFSHHLSNFGFTWKWTEWVDDTDLAFVHPKKSFIIDALDKEIRLSFAQRIKGTLPEPYQLLISSEKDNETPAYKYDDVSTPFSTQGKELGQLVRKKGSDEEIDTVLTQVESEATASGLQAPKLVSTDMLVTAICWVGSKSISHVLAIIERLKDRLTNLAQSDPALRKQIIASVMQYWKDQTGTGVNIVDKLLNYQILTPASIVEWALIDNIERGETLSKAWCFELIEQTTGKVVRRVRSLVHQARDPMLSDEERDLLKQTLERELQAMKALFGSVEDAVSSVATGSEDGMIESSDDLRRETETLIKQWGAKWLRVFRRKGAVEESWVKEEMARPLPPKPEVEVVEVVKEVLMADGNADGDEAGRDGDRDGDAETRSKRVKTENGENGATADDAEGMKMEEVVVV